MIAILFVLLIAVIGFIVYWVTTSKSRQSGSSSGFSSPKRPIDPIEDDEDEATKVRIAGPRLVRTMGGLAVGNEIPVANGVTIGRGQNCTVRLNDQELSSNHAELGLDHGVAVIIDLESTNGTFLNGQQLTPHMPAPLRDKDEIKMGSTILIFKNPQ